MAEQVIGLFLSLASYDSYKEAGREGGKWHDLSGSHSVRTNL